MKRKICLFLLLQNRSGSLNKDRRRMDERSIFMQKSESEAEQSTYIIIVGKHDKKRMVKSLKYKGIFFLLSSYIRKVPIALITRIWINIQVAMPRL